MIKGKGNLRKVRGGIGDGGDIGVVANVVAVVVLTATSVQCLLKSL